MKYLGFGEFSLPLIYPFLIPVFSYLRSLVESQFAFVTPTNSHPFFISFLVTITMIVFGIPYLVLLCFSPKTKPIESVSLEESIHTSKDFVMDKIILESSYAETKKMCLLVLLCMTLICINFPMFYIINYSTNSPLIIYKTHIFIIFFMLINSYFFLGSSIYQHHYFSLALLVIATLTSGYTDLFAISLKVLMLCIVVNLLTSIYLILEKYLMEFKLLTPYQLLLYLGICGVSIHILLFIILYFIPCTPIVFFCESNTGDESIENIILLLGSISGTDYLYCLAYIAAFGLYMLLCFLTLYYLSPIHYCIGEVITSILTWIISTVTGVSNDIWYVSIIGYIIMLFAALVCNEIIILKVWGLELNTKSEIRKRSVMTSSMLDISLNPIEEG